MGEKLVGTELLYRQVHPEFYKNGILGSRAFRPNSSDSGLMSTDRAAIVTAEASFTHYTQQMKKKSACVFALLVEEFSQESVECFADPLEAKDEVEANPAHSLADYKAHEEKSWRTVSLRLKDLADKRGCQYTPLIQGS